MEEVIRDDDGVSEVEAKSVIFTRLKDLSLSSLPTLKSLYQHPLLFPSLETVVVYSCPSGGFNRQGPFYSLLSDTNMVLLILLIAGCPTLFPLGLYSFSGAQVPFPRGLRLGLLLVLSVCWSVAVDGGIAAYTEVLTPEFLIDKGSDSSAPSMEFLSSIVGLIPCFYDHTSKHTVYIRDLKQNLQALRKEMAELNNLYEDVKARVEGAEQRQMMRRKEVGGWICEVEVMVTEVQEILQKGDQEIQKRCLGCCPRNCWSSYKIGKAVSEKLVAVSGQIGKGHFDVVAEMLPRPLVDELPMEETVGSELAYGRICGFLKDPQVGIMGLYGMGGVGKTTLLKKIHNNFLPTSSDFDVVIWDVVSKPSNVEKIQKVLWNKLQLSRDGWECRSTKEEKAAEILRVLKTKKFVLLLDDIWERLDLLEMGVPHPDAQNKSKIVFTTRSQDVCRQMQAQKSIKVECLSSEAAWTLFQKKVGEETLKFHPHIPRLAKIVAEECKGLPLSLVTVGRAMVGEKDPSNWDKVIQDLSKFPAEISDVVIRIETLIEQWIGEGLLGEVHDIYEARNQGHKIVKKLKHACLVESYGLREKWVVMHDVIHDMALWLYGECGKEKNKILVYNDVFRLKEAAEISELKETEKMSLWDQNLEKFPETLMCPNLKTLFPVEYQYFSGVETLLEELESLNDINQIRINISSALSLNKLKRSHKLQRCISDLGLHNWGDVITLELSSSFLKRMEHLGALHVHDCDDVNISMEREMTQNDVIGLSNYNVAREQYFYSLRFIVIGNCSKLLDLTWVVYASCLEALYVEDCESIELVLHDDHGAYEIVEKLDIFSRLKYLKLNRLPRLKSIYQHPLLFPSLEIIKVYDCKSLRSLPFDSNTSNNNLKKIKGETNWWNRLRWKDETIKDSFTPYFQVDKAEAYFAEESETSSIDDDMQEQLFWQQPGFHFSSIVNLLRPGAVWWSEAAAGSMRDVIWECFWIFGLQQVDYVSSAYKCFITRSYVEMGWIVVMVCVCDIIPLSSVSSIMVVD
ncbi:putative disease resistance protein [Vitis vinifera]|uniref:Putative disease resistance protein n=1 Tax=Vitis vinifera TaxID=29760 RepID=A0A438HU12_VITVI|nr:putative disease resistance protein [Vitis vinifera]